MQKGMLLNVGVIQVLQTNHEFKALVMAEMLLLPDHEIKLNQLYPMYYMVKQKYITLQECLEHIAIQCKAERGNLALL